MAERPGPRKLSCAEAAVLPFLAGAFLLGVALTCRTPAEAAGTVAVMLAVLGLAGLAELTRRRAEEKERETGPVSCWAWNVAVVLVCLAAVLLLSAWWGHFPSEARPERRAWPAEQEEAPEGYPSGGSRH